MGIAAGDEPDKAQIETEEAEVQETSEKTPYCITVDDNNVYIIQAYNVYKGYEEAEYYYCYVNENSYELLPIKDTKIVSSLEEAEDEADYYESEGFDLKWKLLKNKNRPAFNKNPLKSVDFYFDIINQLHKDFQEIHFLRKSSLLTQDRLQDAPGHHRK